MKKYEGKKLLLIYRYAKKILKCQRENPNDIPKNLFKVCYHLGIKSKCKKSAHSFYVDFLQHLSAQNIPIIGGTQQVPTNSNKFMFTCKFVTTTTKPQTKKKNFEKKKMQIIIECQTKNLDKP
jgi:ribosomal protein S3AE